LEKYSHPLEFNEKTISGGNKKNLPKRNKIMEGQELGCNHFLATEEKEMVCEFIYGILCFLLREKMVRISGSFLNTGKPP
jgi:hypothetical protein